MPNPLFSVVSVPMVSVMLLAIGVQFWDYVGPLLICQIFTSFFLAGGISVFCICESNIIIIISGVILVTDISELEIEPRLRPCMSCLSSTHVLAALAVGAREANSTAGYARSGSRYSYECCFSGVTEYSLEKLFRNDDHHYLTVSNNKDCRYCLKSVVLVITSNFLVYFMRTCIFLHTY